MGGGVEFSFEFLNVQAVFISTSQIRCLVPSCDMNLLTIPDPSVCATCSFCNTNVRVTMNLRDFLPGTLAFWYRPIPVPKAVLPKRAPAGAFPNNAVTVTGRDFSQVGVDTSAGLGLSCKFGDERVFAQFDPQCGNALSMCGFINCVPPRRVEADGVLVYVSIDGQQFVSVNSTYKAFWYYK